MVSGGRCRRPGRAVGGQAEALARVRRGGRGIDAVFQSLRLLLIGLEGEGVLLGHLGGRRWRGGEAGSKKAMGLRLAPLGAAVRLLVLLLPPETAEALHEELWPRGGGR